MRDKAKDAAEKSRRMKLAMESGFRLFSERGIETVKMSDIAQDCGLSRQSLYRYFSTKTDMVVAIGTWKWKEFITDYISRVPPEKPDELTAADRMRLYLDAFIDMYRNYKDILRYNYYFNSFLANNQSVPEQKQSYTDVVANMKKAFHWLYEKGQKDGTLRRDIPESVMFASSFHIMLAAVTRYAMGLIYVEDEDDPERELVLLKELLFLGYVM